MAIYRDEAGNIISRKKENVRNSEARIRASARYNAKTYKNIAIRIKPADYALIDDYAHSHNISKASLITRAVKYCIANNIDLTVEKEQDS